MEEEPRSPLRPMWQRFHDLVVTKEARKLRAQGEKSRNLWFGLGMFGMVGWSVAIPTVLGVAVGIWIDHRWPSRFSWTLMLLFIGVIVGCWHAWYWVTHESE